MGYNQNKIQYVISLVIGSSLHSFSFANREEFMLAILWLLL